MESAQESSRSSARTPTYAAQRPDALPGIARQTAGDSEVPGAPSQRPGRRGVSRLRRRRRAAALGSIGTLGFLAAWQAVVEWHLLPRDDLPPATAAISQAVQLLGNITFLENVWDTVWASSVGFALAFVIAVPSGLALGMSELLFRWTNAVVELLRPLPPIAFVPLMVLVAGQNIKMKAIIVMLGCIWPLLINTIQGVHSTSGVARSTGRSFGWTRGQVIRRVIWPSALPGVLTGVRITVSIALILCVGAEYIGGSPTGLGSWLLQASLQPGGLRAVCAGVIISGLLGLVLNAAVSILDERFAGWSRTGDSS